MREYLYKNPVTGAWTRCSPAAMTRQAAARTFNKMWPRYVSCEVTAVLTERDGRVIPCPSSVTSVNVDAGLRVNPVQLANARIR